MEFWWKKKKPAEVVAPVEDDDFSTRFKAQSPRVSKAQIVEAGLTRTFQRPMPRVVAEASAMDAAEAAQAFAMDETIDQVKTAFSQPYNGIPVAQFDWFASQGFIGWQMCALIAQHWLVDKSCSMPAKDAARCGYELTVNDGTKIAPEILGALQKSAKAKKLNHNLVQFVRMGRVFGIRVAMFKVQSSDPNYYENPFNPDGVTPGSYKGIAQIDPYWMAPELSVAAASDPSAIDFYEPTYWIINGRRIHKSHLVIFRTDEVADVLKPTYFYGGVPIPQRIAERVYAAERTANEGPMLAMTKRLLTLKTDTAQAFANQDVFEEKIRQWTDFMSNFAVKVIDDGESVEQQDTSLADLDAVIMTQYQLVAAIAGVPATKLLGTSPKGFQSTGEYEAMSYKETLESIQEGDMTPLIERHNLLVIRSEIAPKFSVPPFEVSVTWNPIDSPSEKELADANLVKAQAGQILIQSGAIDADDERSRIIADEQSGYTGIAAYEEPDEIETGPDEKEAGQG